MRILITRHKLRRDMHNKAVSEDALVTSAFYAPPVATIIDTKIEDDGIILVWSFDP